MQSSSSPTRKNIPHKGVMLGRSLMRLITEHDTVSSSQGRHLLVRNAWWSTAPIVATVAEPDSPTAAEETKAGWLHVITGSMYSGKTTQSIYMLMLLIMRLRAKCLSIKHSSDTRYDVQGSNKETTMWSHGSVGCRAKPVATGKLLSLLPEIESEDYDAIFIDEMQFYEEKEARDFIQKVVREQGRLVVVSGLDMDSDRVIWPTMDPLLNDADVIEKLLATCEYCKRQNAACHTYCKVKKTSQVVVGGKDLYAAVCEKCFDEQTKIKNNGQ